MQKINQKLLIIAPTRAGGSVLTPYQDRLLNNVLDHAQTIVGEWDSVEVVGADGSKPIAKLAQDAGSNRILLIGGNLANVVERAVDCDRSGHLLYGIMAETGGRRWIATPHLSSYGAGKDAKWQQASLLGHLYRHIEMLAIGLPGWENPREPIHTRVVTDRKSWLELKSLLERSRVVALDTETRDLRRIGNVLLTIQMGFDGRTGWVLPVAHPDSPLDSSTLREAMGFLKEYFESAPPAVHCFMNAVFDIHQFIDALGVRWYNHKIWDCLHPDMLIATEQGDVSARDMCSIKNPPRVWSYNHEDRRVELRAVTDSRMGPTQKAMVEIEYAGGTIRVTEDELIWSVTRNAYIEAGELLPDEEILAPG